MASRPVSSVAGATATFEAACDLLAPALAGSFRRDVVADVTRARTLGHALRRLRDGMRSNTFSADSRRLNLAALVHDLDRRTRADGFHALHDWDGKGLRFNDDTIPVEVLTFIIEHCGTEPADPMRPAMLLDYYFLYLLALLSLRAWDTSDPGAALDRVTAMLADLQGPGGSGQRFADDAETLLLLATSHYEPDEHGYHDLLARMDALDAPHQARMALVHADCMGGHLRFGFEATYARDAMLMRDDNAADYPWLLWALAVLMREYDRQAGEGPDGPPRDRLVEALFNAFCTDADAVLRNPPPAFAPFEDQRLDLCERFDRHRADLLPAFERVRPTDRAYSPLSFFFNFSQNVLKGIVVDALLRGEPWALTLNDLWTGLPQGAPRNDARARLALTLMDYARASPDIIRGRRMPVIVYDPAAGRRHFRTAMAALGG
jgi:hypothetical protein